MKKTYYIAILFLILICSLIYNILEDNKRVNHFFNFNKNIAEIIVINNDFDKYINSEIGLINFDSINEQIKKAKFNLKEIDDAKIFNNMKDLALKIQFLTISELLNKKMEIVERLKSHNAILNNSIRNSMKIIEKIENIEYKNFFIKIISLNYNTEQSFTLMNEQLQKFTPKDKEEELFLLHSKVILKKFEEYKKLKEDASLLAFGKELKTFEEHYSSHINELINNMKNVILALLLLLSIFIFIFIYYSYTVLKSQIELRRFRNAVDNSHNFVIVTDKDKKIKYVNRSMLLEVGYKLEEVIGKNPAIFAAGFVSSDSYKDMNKTIFEGKKWTGEFINKGKDGKLIYERASITPIFNEDGEIEEFLAIKYDITQEKEILKSLKEKDHRLTQQARMVVMNEILNSIAHQWRQPLSVISTATSGLLIHKDYDTLNDEIFKELTDSILENSKYLSHTIDNFKSFFKTGNDKTLFNIKNSFEKAQRLLEYRLNTSEIKYVFNCEEDISLIGIENDFIQVIVNLLNNSMDALENIGKEIKFIFVDIIKDKETVIIKIKDNAKGINEEILDKIFEPYFTTKYNSQGTGMGLYMSHQIITEQFKGEISLDNIIYIDNENKYSGVECTIILPIKHENLEDVRPTI